MSGAIHTLTQYAFMAWYLVKLQGQLHLYCVQTYSGAHPASYPIVTGVSFPDVKRSGREADQSPPSSAEVRMLGAIPPFPNTSSWRGA